MAVQTTLVNKPLNPRGNDQSPLAYNRAKLFSGKALSFDGVNDKVDCGTLDITAYTGISIAMYLNADTVTSVCIPLSLRHSGGDDIRLVAELNGFTYAIDDGTLYQFATPINANEWYYTVLTFDGSTLKGYLNGQEVGSMSASFDFSTADGQLIIGERFSGTFDYDGQLSNVKIFNTALTAAQVADLYNNPEKVVPTGVDNTALKLWLPMQEGAGTTAYDGSGNGNHGTISGATYVHGIGAPVSQTAVISWNKGTNIIPESENPDNLPSFDARGFTKNSSTETSPIGTSDAHKYTENNTNSNPALVWSGDYSTGASQTLKVYLKADASTSVALSTQGQTSGGNINVTTEWQQFEVTQSVNATSGPHIGGFATITQGSGIVLYMWHPQMSYGDSVYIPTLSTAQTSDVLLPQGITTGRDITGVNLFENVRKQGALNLDGNSWAEVHDNASLDLTNLSLECWFDNTNAYDSIRYLFDKSAGSVNGFELRLVSQNSVQLVFRNLSTISKVATIPISGWVHVVGIYDGSDIIVYVDGTLAGSVASSGSIGTNDDVLSIGGDNTFAPYRLNKPIAQPRIYNRALTAEEVARNYNNAKSIYTNS